MVASEKQIKFINSLMKQLDRKSCKEEKFNTLRGFIAVTPSYVDNLEQEEASNWIEDLLELKK